MMTIFTQPGWAELRGSTDAGVSFPKPIGKAAARAAQFICSMPAGWAQIAARKPRFVVFGEYHGTQEAPAFIGDIACALVARGQSVLVAVEHDATQNAAFQAAWSLGQTQFEDALQKAGWAGREDGVGSETMFRLLVRLHSLKDQGYPIGIVAFNGTRDDAQRERFKSLPGQGSHEAAQAENIHDAAETYPYDKVLVLTGNLHARKHPVERGGISFKPMAMVLGASNSVVSLNMQAASGSRWNCTLKPGREPPPGMPIMSDAIECGIHPFRGSADLKRSNFMSLKPLPNIKTDIDYDGFFWLGHVHGSKPAVPNSSSSGISSRRRCRATPVV
jgi:hypothetical protein